MGGAAIWADLESLHFGFQSNIKNEGGERSQVPLSRMFNDYHLVDRLVSHGRPRKGEFVRQN